MDHLSMLHFSHMRRPHPNSVNGWVLLKQVSNPQLFVEPKMLALSDLNVTFWGVESLGQGRETTREAADGSRWAILGPGEMEAWEGVY